jgi:uncharacterized membrane protein YkvA (DUF1232 family)
MRIVKSLIVIAFGALGLLYLLNPTAGILELIPDNLPLIGNLDEAGATLLVVNALAYFGIDLGRLLGRDTNTPPSRQA